MVLSTSASCESNRFLAVSSSSRDPPVDICSGERERGEKERLRLTEIEGEFEKRRIDSEQAMEATNIERKPELDGEKVIESQIET
jgi:hypothetical protein